MPTLTEQVVNAVRGLTRLVVAVSGGPDSVCLLHALAQAQTLQLTVACLDHGLRAEARAEVRMVRGLARKLKAGFLTGRVDTKAFAKTNKLSLEDAARQLRYSFLQRSLQMARAEAVAVAHTEDDQAETVLLHLLRGSGLEGLAGMAAETALMIDGQRLLVIRPLLSVARAEVEAYCRAQRLPVAHDASNHDLAFMRNRLRHRLLPALARFNPQIRPALARLAELTQGDVGLLRGLVEDALMSVSFGADRALIPWRTWLGWPDALRRRAIRASIARLSGEPAELESGPLLSALAALPRVQTGARFDLGLGWCLDRERSGVAVTRQTGTPSALPALKIKAGVWSLNTIRANPDRWVAYVDAGAVRTAMRAAGLGGRVQTGLSIRVWRAGDRIQPLGLGGGRVKLSDLFGEAGIPTVERRQWPVVRVGDAIVWVAGLRLDARFAAREGMPMLRLTLRQA
jgi:tRNA(Ile)-lysidine synthase